MRRTDHVAFRVSNMDEAVRFYTEKLGLRLLSRDVNLKEQEEFAFLELEGANLELIQLLGEHDFPRPQVKPPYCPHLALITDNMEKTLEMIRHHDVPIVKGPLEIQDTVKWIYLRDPDNNIIEYVQWLR